MTTYTLAGQRYQMSKEMKSRLLEVTDNGVQGVLTVRSGSDKDKVYDVTYTGNHATGCPCKSRVKCSHMIAAEKYLAQPPVMREDDVRAHVEDSIRSGEFEFASCYGCGQRVRHEGYCHKCA